MLKLGRYQPQKIQSSHLKAMTGSKSPFWLTRNEAFIELAPVRLSEALGPGFNAISIKIVMS